MQAKDRSRRAFRPAGLAIALALTALVALSGIAIAALEQESKRFDVAAGQMAGKVASCKPGQTAVSGGFNAPLGGGSGPSMLALDSTREGERGWRFRTTNLGSDGRAKAFVYCDRHNVNLTAVSEEFTVDSSSLGSAEAECGGQRQAVAGGFDFPDANNTNLVASKRTGDGAWELTLFNATGASRLYEVFVYCRQGGPELTTSANSIRANESERFGQTVGAECPGSQEVRSGGFEAQYEGEAEFADLGIVHSSKRQGKDRWKVTAFAPIGDPEIKAYAYCQ